MLLGSRDSIFQHAPPPPPEIESCTEQMYNLICLRIYIHVCKILHLTQECMLIKMWAYLQFRSENKYTFWMPLPPLGIRPLVSPTPKDLKYDMRIWTTTFELFFKLSKCSKAFRERERRGDGVYCAVLPDPGKPSRPITAKFTTTLEPIMATNFHPGL